MMIIDRHPKGASTLEYIILILIILGVLFVFKDYVSRAFHGRWKNTGDSFGMGRQYKPGKSIDCTYAQENATTNFWYEATCYQERVTTQCIPTDPKYLNSEKLRECENGVKSSCKVSYCD